MAPNRTLARSLPAAGVRTLAALVPLWLASAASAQDAAPDARHGQHRLAAHQQRAGADDDAARAGALLRRSGAREEHAVAVHAVPGGGRRSGRALDPDRLHALLRDGRGLHRRPLEARPRRHRQQHALGHLRRPRVRVRHVPGDVRDHHACADDRRLRRAHALRAVSGLHHALAAGRLLPARAHGVGRRLDRSDGRQGLRRRHGRAHVERLLGAGRRALPRQAARLRQGADAAAQPAPRRDRRQLCCGSAGSASTPAAS